MKFQSLVKAKTFDQLLKENLSLENRLKEAREAEIQGQKKLRQAFDELEAIQESIKILDEKFDKNCFQLQELKK